MSIKAQAHEHIKLRAAQGNVSDRVIIDPEEYESGKTYYTVTGVFDGALDEDFVTESTYAVNVADWLGELYNQDREPGVSWYVLVVEFFPGEEDDEVDMDGDLIYKVTDESFTG